MALDFCRKWAMSLTMAVMLLIQSIDKFLIRSFWAFRCCQAVKIVWSHAPMVASTRPATTPKEESAGRTNMDVNSDNRRHPPRRPHATLLALLPPQQQHLSRHRTSPFPHLCQAALAGLDEGDFTEGHELDRKWKIAKAMIGR